MSLTIEQLTEVPFLRTRFLAGVTGGNRPVVWAHTCELPAPWNWLGTGELLMTDGYNFPSDAANQIDFVRKLAEAGISGVTLGEGFHAPPLTPEAAAYADEIAFPVLETAHAVRFVTVARTVADRNSHKASASLVRIVRLYDVLRRLGIGVGQKSDLLEKLGTEAGAELHAIDVVSGAAVLPALQPLEESKLRAVVDVVNQKGLPLPAFTRVRQGESGTLMVLPLGGAGHTVLVAQALVKEGSLDLVVLQHAAVIVGFEVERHLLSALRKREAGSRLLQQLVDGTIDLESAQRRLDGMRLASKPWRAICAVSGGAVAADEISRRLTADHTPHILLDSAGEAQLLTNGTWFLTDNARIFEGLNLTVGVSLPIHSHQRVPDGMREARWAAESARSTSSAISFYGEDAPRFFPRTVAEGEAAVSSILGSVIAHDELNNSDLLQSLEVFFEVNRSWKEAAERLGIHKQTLVYRMRKIETLSGKMMRNLQDQTDLYLAVKTVQRLRLGC